MSRAFTVQFHRFNEIDRKLEKLASKGLLEDTAEGIAGVIESQVRRRIDEEKEAPDGSEWKEWSQEWANNPERSRRSGGKLELYGHLLDSIESQVQGGDTVIVGSPLVYAGRNHDQRPYLGLSSDNEEEIIEVVNDVFRDAIE